MDDARHGEAWDSGEGSFRVGGRWNSKGVRAVYSSLDPATAILEVAVHKGFRALDTVAHVLTSLTISAASDVHIVQPSDVPSPNWLRPGSPGAGQQASGDALLASRKFVAIPSAVSTYSSNVVFDPGLAAGAYAVRSQERFALDTRLPLLLEAEKAESRRNPPSRACPGSLERLLDEHPVQLHPAHERVAEDGPLLRAKALASVRVADRADPHAPVDHHPRRRKP